MVQRLSTMLAVRLRRFSRAIVCEAGNVMMSVMDHASKQFAVELVLPWASNIALLETKIGGVRRVPAHLAAAGYCCAAPHECLTEILAYALEVSIEGLPPLLAKFWRRIALAVPGEPGKPPPNVIAIDGWLSRELAKMEGEREKRTCKALLWFIKGLALGEDAADPEEAAAAAESPPPEVGSRWAKEMGTRKGREAQKKKQGIAGLLEVAKIQKRQSEEKLRIVQKMAEAAREAKAKSRTPSPERRSRTPSPVPLAQRLREASKGCPETACPGWRCPSRFLSSRYRYSKIDS